MMKTRITFFLLFLSNLFLTVSHAAISTSLQPIRNYYQMLDSLRRGWNTWDSRSMLTLMYLPESFALKVALVDENGSVAEDLRAGNQRQDAAIVHPYDHTFPGTYTEVDACWHGVSVKLRATSDDDRLIVVLTPTADNTSARGRLRITPEYAWRYTNDITGKDNIQRDPQGHFHFWPRDSHIHIYGRIAGQGLTYDEAQGYFCDASAPVLIYTGDSLSVSEAVSLLQSKKAEYDRECARYGENAELYRAIQTILSWDTVYDPGDNIVVSPVSRNWNLWWTNVKDFGGYILFNWDTYFASWMASEFSRELAYANAIEMTLAVDKCGFVPKSRSDHDSMTGDCSQPPVGSLAVWNIYQRFRERWFLELLYPRLLMWNRWWLEARQTDGLLCWGSNPKRMLFGERFTGSTTNAILESGLDNSTMYDGVKINPETWQLNLQDVGLTSLYVMDCHYLAMIARELSCKQDARELERRADTFRRNIQRFWCEEDGMFYNINSDDGSFNRRTSCTNFYVLLADAATPAQAKRIVEEHLLNENEFWGEWVIPMSPRNDPGYPDQNYWRGRIWGPTNFLVYLGLRRYHDDSVRTALVEKSRNLMLRGWRENGYIYENWNAITGAGGDRYNSECFYHWGALMGYMSLIEASHRLK